MARRKLEVAGMPAGVEIEVAGKPYNAGQGLFKYTMFNAALEMATSAHNSNARSWRGSPMKLQRLNSAQWWLDREATTPPSAT